MKNNYIYVPGLSESVADEVKKEKDAEAPRFITGTGAVKKEAVTHDRGVLRTRKVDDRQSIQIPVDISHILGNLITVIFNYQILRKPLKILSL